MPKLQIEENWEVPKDFDWGKSWRAVRIWKELRADGEFLYAFVVKKYTETDIGELKEEELWIGRRVEYRGKRKFDVDPKSKTFSKRIDEAPQQVTEEVYNDATGRYEEQTYTVNAKKIYIYEHNVKDKTLIPKYQSLCGSLPGGSATQLIMLYGSRPVTIEQPDDFWKHSVLEFKNVEQKSDSIFDKKKGQGQVK